MIDPGEVETTRPMGAAAIVALVRAAADAATDPAGRKLAALNRATEPDVIAAIAIFPNGSADAVRVRAELKALGVPTGQLNASIHFARSQSEARVRAEAQRIDEAREKKDSVAGWEGRLTTDTKGEAESNVANAIVILRCHSDWAGVLAWDDFQEAIVFRRPAPWDEDDAPQTTEQGDEGRYLTDSNATAVGAWLCRHYRVTLSDEQVYKAARVVARGKGQRFNSMQDYFNGLKWDGIDRIGSPDGERSWLTAYLGVADSPYVRFVGQAWLVSAPARTFKPGCQADHVLILEGRPGPTNQGGGKSTALRLLFGEQFSDSPVDMHSKDRFLNLRGVLCQSFDELASLGPSAADHVKTFLSAQYDIFRPPYARESIKALRRCILAGTVNPRNGAGYLRDETGARRFWPVTCGVVAPIDRDAITRDRDQIWAQAVHLYRSGTRWHPETPEEKVLCEFETAERAQPDPWDRTVEDWVKGKRTVTGADVLRFAVGIAVKDQEPREFNRVGAILARLGWIAGRETVEGEQRRCFREPSPETLPDRMVKAEAVVKRLEREMLTALEQVNRLALQMDAAGMQRPSAAQVEAERDAEHRDLTFVAEQGQNDEAGGWADR